MIDPVLPQTQPLLCVHPAKLVGDPGGLSPDILTHTTVFKPSSFLFLRVLGPSGTIQGPGHCSMLTFPLSLSLTPGRAHPKKALLWPFHTASPRDQGAQTLSQTQAHLGTAVKIQLIKPQCCQKKKKKVRKENSRCVCGAGNGTQGLSCPTTELQHSPPQQ
jgi:hypothetical protein